MSRWLNICFVIGTRPEVIKCWPVIRHLRSRPEFKVSVLLTGQHRELLHQATDLLDVSATIDLDVMTHNQSLPALTATLCTRLGGALGQLNPDCVIVQGDTTSVFVGALAAFYANIPVGHLEAGLRTSNVRNPFPEEMNRRLTTVLAKYHFAPTETAKADLLRENVPADSIWVTGNTGIDALRIMSQHLHEYPIDPQLKLALADVSARVIAVTIHRRENRAFMQGIAHAIRAITNDHPDLQVVFPVHLSQAVRDAFLPILKDHDRCHLIDPLDYANFVRLLNRCFLVLTDSGGVQEEAPYLGKPVLVVRRTTERPEAVQAGAARLIGEQPHAIINNVTQLLTDPQVYKSMARSISPYGDGHASQRIADVLLNVQTPVTAKRPTLLGV